VLTKKEAAMRLGISVSSVDRLVREGTLRCVIILNRRKFREADVEQFLKDHEFRPKILPTDVFPGIRYVKGMKVV